MSDKKSAAHKPKLVRDSFTIPKSEYAAIEALKTRAIALGTSVKKSELLRAGLMALVAMNDAGFKAAVAAVPQLKPGRPAAEAVQAIAPKAATRKTPAKTAVRAARGSAPPESPSDAPRRARGGAATRRRPS